MIFDIRYILFVMVPAMLLMGFAQLRLRSAFAKYRQMPNSRGLAGRRRR